MELTLDDLQSSHRDFDLCLLALQNITWMLVQMEVLHQQLRITALSVNSPVPAEMLQETEEALRRWGAALNAVQQEIGDWMSDSDCVSPLDVLVTSPGFEVWNMLDRAR